jgi:hypothetical protein
MAKSLRQSKRRCELVRPNPADLIESLRDFGYTLPSALADLIDNCITAEATKIRVVVEPSSPAPHIAVLDNGHGMTEARLVEAMRMGSLGPLARRSANDLGRFGLGMKTASLSQGRCLTVISKRPNTRRAQVGRWDLTHVKAAKDWQLLLEPTPLAKPYEEAVNAQAQGTAIIIEQLDRASFLLTAPPDRASHLAEALEGIRAHLAMVFHRFIIEDGLEIRLGESAIQAWDPYLTSFSTALPTEKLAIPLRESRIEITPFVLPHHSRLTDSQHDAAAGPLGWNAHQGFYIYRSRRLIIPGTWLNLNLRKEEHYKLARIRVDIPNSMDTDWQLNVMKSHVAAPAALRDDFRRIASDVRRQASDVYRVRGERQTPPRSKPEHFVWRRESSRTGVRYCIDRSHPVVKALLHGGCGHDPVLAEAISLIESTLPIAAILQEPSKALDGSVHSELPVDLDALVDMLLHAEQYFVRTGKSLADARNMLLSCDPFVRFRDPILDRLSERTGTATNTNGDT